MQIIREEVAEYRTPAYDIDPLFVNRWSPRAMTGEPLAEEDFLPLFEAARWGPLLAKRTAISLPVRDPGERGVGDVPRPSL